MAQGLEAFTEVAHYGIRVCINGFIHCNAELNRACIAEYAHTNANVAALWYPEHWLYQFTACQINRFPRAGYVGQHCRGLVAEQVQGSPLQNVRAASEQIQQAVGYLGLIGLFEAVHILLHLPEAHYRVGNFYWQANKHQAKLVPQGFDGLVKWPQVEGHGNTYPAARDNFLARFKMPVECAGCGAQEDIVNSATQRLGTGFYFRKIQWFRPRYLLAARKWVFEACFGFKGRKAQL